MTRHADVAVAELERGLDITNAVYAGRHSDIPCRTYHAGTATDAPTLVWIHGGAFSHGGLDQLESHAVAAAIAQSGITVTAVD